MTTRITARCDKLGIESAGDFLDWTDDFQHERFGLSRYGRSRFTILDQSIP